MPPMIAHTAAAANTDHQRLNRVDKRGRDEERQRTSELAAHLDDPAIARMWSMREREFDGLVGRVVLLEFGPLPAQVLPAANLPACAVSAGSSIKRQYSVLRSASLVTLLRLADQRVTRQERGTHAVAINPAPQMHPLLA